jgi:septal ring factor EnvC (AmiA/AmiB activator)
MSAAPIQRFSPRVAGACAVVLLAFVLLAVPVASAEPASDATSSTSSDSADEAAAADPAERPIERRERLEREIERLRADRDRLQREERGLVGRLEALEAEARLLDARLEDTRAQLAETEASLAEISAEERSLSARLSDQREALAEHMRVLWRLGPAARVRPVLEAPDADRLAAGLRLVEELTRRRDELVRSIEEDRVAASLLRTQREAREAELDALEEEARAARDSLGRAIASRRRILERIRDDAEVRARAIAELERASERLGETIAGLRPDEPVSLDVQAFRGALRMPVEGRVSRAFGDRRDPRFGTRIPHPGWDIAAEFGTPVTPVFEGRVVFADWFRAYGLTVIVDHGESVHSVYAHLSAITSGAGAFVTPETIIGRVGDTGSLRGSVLYFEIRDGGKAEDPATWIDR